MIVFDVNFRPWPHIFQSRGRAAKFYKAMDRNIHRDVIALRTYDTRDDADKYTTLIRRILNLFGLGIIDSLEYTMHRYLRQTNGDLANDKRELWEEKAVEGMLCHNNNAERPFAVLKQYKRMYPSISLRNLAALSQSLVNGTHRPAEFGHAAGLAITSDPRLRSCVGMLCGVKNKVRGKITELLRAANRSDTIEVNTNRKKKAIEKYEANVRKKAKKASLMDYAEEVADNSLVTDVKALAIQLLARSKSGKARISFLKEQFHARVSGEHPRIYTSLGNEFRTQHGKLRLTSQTKSVTEEAYLISLLKAMLNEDSQGLGLNENMPQKSQDFIRTLPTLSVEYSNPKAALLKAEFSQQIANLATPIDDPVYMQLQEKYLEKILYDCDTRATAKLFRVASIQFVRSYTSSRFSCWEATCEPVYRDAATGQFHVPSEVQVPGSRVTVTHALQGYALAEYANGIDEDPTYLPWVDNYIAHFSTVILPKYMSSITNDKPSSNDLPSSQDLPSSRRTTTQASLTSPPASRSRARSRKSCS